MADTRVEPMAALESESSGKDTWTQPELIRMDLGETQTNIGTGLDGLGRTNS